MGTTDMGSWFTQSTLYIYGDNHVIYDKSKYKCHALLITLWRLCVLKHTVERSTHMCSGITLLVRLECGQVTPPRHTSPFLPQIKDAFYIVFVTRCLCRLSLGHPLPTYIILLKENIS
jgi:hypothetical protein